LSPPSWHEWTIRDFTKLDVWERSHRLVLDIYQATETYPADERFELRSQTRRAATSVPTNIAEGSGRNTRADYARFIDMAVGSTSELEYELILGRDLGYLSHRTAQLLISETRQIRSMLVALTRRVAPNRL
jgi:four helix bundle protein